MQTRREFGKAIGSVALGAALSGRAIAQGAMLPTTFNGVRMGVCLYDFRDLPRQADEGRYIDPFVDACRQVGVGLVEINASLIEPATKLPFSGIPRMWDAPLTGAQADAYAKMSPAEVQAERERLREWRLSTPSSFFAQIREKFARDGLSPFSYVMTFTPDMTPAEIDAIFRQARALGVGVFSTNQTKVEMAPRLAPYADKYRMDLGFHNHFAVENPNEVASVNSLERVMAVSPRCKVNLDLGHFTAGNQDELGFIRAHFDRITHFHIKDRKRNFGPNMPWGQGDSPIKAVLLEIRNRQSNTPALVEYEYRGAGSGIVETKKCIEYMKEALA